LGEEGGWLFPSQKVKIEEQLKKIGKKREAERSL